MSKLVLSMDGLVLKEIALAKERTTIGRKPHNDIQIDNLAVSGEHAVVVTILSDSFLEDLGSTNGTMVNGQAIKKHFLQNNDVIELGKYKLKYVGDSAESVDNSQEFEKTVVMRPQQQGRPEAVVPNGVATFSNGQTPPAGLVDTSRNAIVEAPPRPLTAPQQVSSAPQALSTTQPPVTMPLPRPMSIMMTQPAIPVLRNRVEQPSGDLNSQALPDPLPPTGPLPPPQNLARRMPDPPARPAPQPAAVRSVPPAEAAPARTAPPPGRAAQAPAGQAAVIQILTGSNAGRELDLVKPLTTLGRPQVQVAVITKRPQGYFITHVEGQKFPTVNGKPIDAQPQALGDHDIIELAGVKMEFYYK